MRDTGTRSSSEIENLGTRRNVDLVNTSQNGCSQLGPERVPHSVLCLGGCGRAAVFSGRGCTVGGQIFVVDGDALFAVDGLAGGVVKCNLLNKSRIIELCKIEFCFLFFPFYEKLHPPACSSVPAILQA